MQERLDGLVQYTTTFVHKTVCRGLFRAHRAAFALAVSARVQAQDTSGACDDAAWQFLLRGSSPDAPEPVPAALSLSTPQWNALRALAAAVPAFSQITASVRQSSAEWERYAQQSEMWRAAPPLPYAGGAEWPALHRLLIAKCLQPSQIPAATQVRFTMCVRWFSGTACVI